MSCTTVRCCVPMKMVLAMYSLLFYLHAYAVVIAVIVVHAIAVVPVVVVVVVVVHSVAAVSNFFSIIQFSLNRYSSHSFMIPL